MADGTENKHPAQKLIDWGKGLALAIGGLLLVDQGQLFEDTFPAVWEGFKKYGIIAVNQLQIVYKQSRLFFQKNWRRVKRISIVWWVVAAALLFGGMLGKAWSWSESATLTMRLAGIFLFAGYWWIAAAFARPFYYGWKAVESLARDTANAVTGTVSHYADKIGVKIPVSNLTAEDAVALEEGALAFQRFFYTLACIVLLFGTFFAPVGTFDMAIKLLKYGVPLAFVAALSAKFGWQTEGGWKLLKLAVLIAFVAMVLGDFLPDWARDWYRNLNRSETVTLWILFFPGALWLLAAFWKAQAEALKRGAKILTVICCILFVALWVKGVITTHELASTSDTTAAKMTQFQQTATNRVLDKAIDVVTPKPDSPSATPKAPNVQPPPPAGGTYRRPQDRTETSDLPAAHHPQTRRVQLPRPEKPRHYDNLEESIDDLDADD